MGSFSSYRYAKYYKENNVEKRTLIKVFGIRFDILVFGNVSICPSHWHLHSYDHVLMIAVVPQEMNVLMVVISWHSASHMWDKRGGRNVFGVLQEGDREKNI